MTVIGNLKRIARRPSLLLRGSKVNNTFSDTDSDELGDSFESEDEFPGVGAALSHQPLETTSRRAAEYKPPPSNQELCGIGSQSCHRPSVPNHKAIRRASMGEVLGHRTYTPAQIPQKSVLSDQTSERVKETKNRSRNSLTPSGARSAHERSLPHSPPAIGPSSRRHSLSNVPDFNRTKTLYTIRPESASTPVKRTSPSLRSSLPSTRKQGSNRSIATFHSQETSHSHGSHRSGNSFFSSTGWSIASNGGSGHPESPLKSPRRALMRPKLPHSSAHNPTNLYMPQQYDSKRTIGSLDSSFSTTGWSVQNDADSVVAHGTMVEE